MLKKDQDIQAGIVVILFALPLSTQFGKLSFMQSIYPKLLVALMALSGVGIILRAAAVARRAKQPYRVLSLRDFMLQAVVPGAFVIAMCLLLRRLGFYIDTFIVVAGICLLQDFIIEGRLRITARSAAKIFAFSAGCSAALYVCFNILLKLSTPIGMFGF